MARMKALVLHESAEQRLCIEDVDLPKLAEGEVLVRIGAASLNHRDQWIREGKYAKITYPSILGSDGCGVVEDGSDEFRGKEVILNPNINWGESEQAQASGYSILGMPVWGTFAEYCIVQPDRLHLKPEHLTVEQAAALPLSGLTAWRAVAVQGDVQPGHNVLVTGIGGGVAQFAFEFAQTIGARVFVTSSSSEKLQRVIEMGAAGDANYSVENWHKQLKLISGGFDVIIDGAGGDQINLLLELLKPGGRLVCYGATLGRPASLNIQRVFWNHLQIRGTTMGSDKDFAAMVDFVSANKVFPIIDSVYSFRNIDEAFYRMERGEQFGKIVVTMAEPPVQA